MEIESALANTTAGFKQRDKHSMLSVIYGCTESLYQGSGTEQLFPEPREDVGEGLGEGGLFNGYRAIAQEE